MNRINTSIYLEDQLKNILKEFNPTKLAEITEEAKRLGYNSLMEYLLNAHELYKGLAEENRKGKLIVMLTHNQAPIKKEGENVCINLGEQDRIIHLKVKGLEYRHNGNGYQK